MYNAVKAIDPWHIIIGALQCMQEFWQWSDYASFLEPAAPTPAATIPVGAQPKLQLALDLIMWEVSDTTPSIHTRSSPQLLS